FKRKRRRANQGILIFTSILHIFKRPKCKRTPSFIRESKVLFSARDLWGFFCKNPLLRPKRLKMVPVCGTNLSPRGRILCDKMLCLWFVREEEMSHMVWKCWEITSSNLQNIKGNLFGGFWKMMWVTHCTSSETNKRRRPASA
ncbi:hypothetical protein AMECASPLE_036735, partial [Ameca splendens]